jgi:hypothetical protein
MQSRTASIGKKYRIPDYTARWIPSKRIVRSTVPKPRKRKRIFYGVRSPTACFTCEYKATEAGYSVSHLKYAEYNP